jgi:hypothetical protein
MADTRVFIDFETNTAGEVFLVAVHWNAKFEQIILNESLAGAARAKGLKCRTMKEFTDQLSSFASDTSLILCAYTRAEAHVLAAYFESKQTPLPDLKYCDLHKAAKKWVNKRKHKEFNDLPPFRIGASTYEQRRLRWSLASVMRVTNYTAPADYAPRKTTQRINSVITALDKKGGDFDKISPTNKAKFTKLLKHNEFDVMALVHLFDEIQLSDPHLIEGATYQISEISNNDGGLNNEC